MEALDERNKRKAKEMLALSKIKDAKAAAKKRKRDADSDDSDADLARALFDEATKVVPGQIENCDICGKRFTVTPYTPAGPEGGLLCAKCAKGLKNNDPEPKKKVRKSTGGVGRRRNIQREKMDGTYTLGGKNLIRICVETLAKNVDLADDLGDLPEHQIDKIARMISKRRLLNPRTLSLFVRPKARALFLYDAAYLSEDDFRSFFQVCQDLKKLKIRNGIQFKDTIMEYLLSRNIYLESFYLSGANLLSDVMWKRFFEERGECLRTLQIYFTDKHVGDDVIAHLVQHCQKLTRLAIKHNQKVTNEGVKNIANLEELTNLSLHLINKATSKTYAHVIENIGASLESLCLKNVSHIEDDVLCAIHNNCRKLRKLKITDSENMTDDGFAKLFTDWDNPPLKHIDFEACRFLEASKPRENPDKVGLCSDGFCALMAHSGQELETLNVHACRHIGHEAFEHVFREDKVYPELRDLEISFCEQVTPFIMGCIFRSCPKLKNINVFGCMKVKDRGMKVPPTVIMVGGSDAYGGSV